MQLMTHEDYLVKDFKDTGGWAYVVSGRHAGSLMVNCTNTDGHGKSWASY